MWQMVGILAELERSLIQERTKAGRAAAMARGVQMGRKPLLSAQQATHARQLIEQGESPGHVANSLKVSRRTLYRALAASSLAKLDSCNFVWKRRQHCGNGPLRKWPNEIVLFRGFFRENGGKHVEIGFDRTN